MGVFFWIVIVVVVIILVARNVDKKEEKAKQETFNRRVSGIKQKYRTLIEGLIPPNMGVKLIKESPSLLVYELNTGTGVTRFEIDELVAECRVTWKFEHVLMGNHGKTWSFSKNEDQERMLETIYRDMDKINQQFS